MDATPHLLSENASWWRRRCGIREVLIVALPLVISTASWSLTNFIDRMFLFWHSKEAMAASLPAGMLHFSILCFPIGVASYVNTFVSQYNGAGEHRRIGPIVVQGILWGCFVAPFFFLAAIPANYAFHVSTVDPEVARLEGVYFWVLAFGGGASIVANAMSAFFSGRQKNGIVMAVDSSSCLVNMVLDYFFIFGYVSFVPDGIAGAAWATVISQWAKVVLYGGLIVLPANWREYGFGEARLWDWSVMRRLLRYGSASGVQLALEVSALTFFLLMMGRLGSEAMTATNLAFSINGFAFVPLVGLGIAVSTLVGREIGAGQPSIASNATWSGFMIALVYGGTMGIIFLTLPDLFLTFHKGTDHSVVAQPEGVLATVTILLQFVAVFCLLDATNVVFVSALKGAGDVRFVMVATCVISILLVGGGAAVLLTGGGLYGCWVVLTLWVFTMGATHFVRFLIGRWRSMKVIEPELVSA
ncbi:MATE family efflux transporter [Blastopirellula sp. JC732]|uniref:Multidrug-efflux transporter n=1 Tax=Blastopirellula sediminis TaxID=2894196 RepID=A0A9X1MSW2_9BACT|nr:MATE family efflux transporter [Blastopirellula sediminis]MCC9604460.1 MATE family efflux transporter [Blastopirellula sediminis]MCC9632241.1 MATE family efflux transporter [Blastopirellula sediminis]